MLLGVNIDNRGAVTRQGLELPANRSQPSTAYRGGGL